MKRFEVQKFCQMDQKPKCKDCLREFSSASSLSKHHKKKLPCYSVLECVKCFKTFNKPSELKQHQNRKTPCEPIQGNPLEKTPKNACHFCYKKFANKSSLKRHFNTCDIKNNNIAVLFKKVQELTAEVRNLKEEKKENTTQKANNTVTGNNNMNKYLNSPHNNTTLNIQLNNYDSVEHIDFLTTVLKKVLPAILEMPVREDVPRVVQIQDRIQQIVSSCFRNPDHKEMQNVYVLDEELKKDNAYIYQGDTWKIQDWDKLGTEMIQKIRMHASKIKTKSDILKVMKHIMILTGSDIPSVERMTEAEIQLIYKQMGEKLKFDTILI